MSGKRHPGITASELHAQLSNDRAYQARGARADADLEAKAEMWQRAEAPIVADLRLAGIPVNSVWELVNTEKPYPVALPVLLKHLEQDYPDRVREAIARALAVPSAAFGWKVLLNQFQRSHKSGAKDGLAAALAATVTGDTIAELIDLVREPRHGDSRLLLLRGLRRVDTPEARRMLRSLTTDPALGREASRMLRRGR